MVACSQKDEDPLIYRFPDQVTELKITYSGGGVLTTKAFTEEKDLAAIKKWYLGLDLKETIQETHLETLEGRILYEFEMDGLKAFTYEDRGNTAKLFLEGIQYEVVNPTDPPFDTRTE